MGVYRFNDHVIDNTTIIWDDTIKALKAKSSYDYIVDSPESLTRAINEISSKKRGGSIYLKADGGPYYNNEGLPWYISERQESPVLLSAEPGVVIYAPQGDPDNPNYPTFKIGGLTTCIFENITFQNNNIFFSGPVIYSPYKRNEWGDDEDMPATKRNFISIRNCTFINQFECYRGYLNELDFSNNRIYNNRGPILRSIESFESVNDPLYQDTNLAYNLYVEKNISTSNNRNSKWIFINHNNIESFKIQRIFFRNNSTVSSSNNGNEIYIKLGNILNRFFVIDNNEFRNYNIPNPNNPLVYFDFSNIPNGKTFPDFSLIMTNNVFITPKTQDFVGDNNFLNFSIMQIVGEDSMFFEHNKYIRFE